MLRYDKQATDKIKISEKDINILCIAKHIGILGQWKNLLFIIIDQGKHGHFSIYIRLILITELFQRVEKNLSTATGRYCVNNLPLQFLLSWSLHLQKNWNLKN